MKLSMTRPRRCAVVNARHPRVRWRVAVVLALLANTAWAADCDMQLSSREVDYGALHRGELTSSARVAAVPLGKRQLTLSVICRQPIAIGLRFDGDPVGADAYRFGGRGSFTVRLSEATVDGRPVQLFAFPGSGGTGAASSVLMRPDGIIGVTAQGARLTGKAFTFKAEIDTTIDDAATRVRDLSVLEGRGTFRLVPR